MKNLAPPNIDSLIVEVRRQRVILDSDLASIYGVPTRRLNEQVKRNARRFPPDFLFRLTTEEMEQCRCSRSQFVTLKYGRSIEGPDAESDPLQIGTGAPGSNLKSQIATSSSTHGGRRKLPYAFTEHGAIMAANVLNSPQAVDMSVFVVRAFVKMREHVLANAAILKRLAEIDKTLLIHDTALREVFQKLRPLLEPPPAPPKPEIGFHVKEDAVPYRVKRKA